MASQAKAMVEVDNLKPLLSALNKLPKDVQGQIRDVSVEVAESEAVRIRAGAARAGRQAALAAGSVRARRDRIPALVAGGAKRLPGRKKGSYGDVFFGSEFGGRARPTTQQFPRHQGTEGYWLFPTLRDDTPLIFDAYATVVDKVIRDWDRAGAGDAR